MVAQKTSVLLTIKKDKHTTYRNSAKGQARDYRRYKKKLAIRMLIKQAKMASLAKELLDAAKI